MQIFVFTKKKMWLNYLSRNEIHVLISIRANLLSQPIQQFCKSRKQIFQLEENIEMQKGKTHREETIGMHFDLSL